MYNDAMTKIRVGIVRGGTSSEYDASLRSGGRILAHMPLAYYDPIDILISKEGIWYMRGFPIEPRDIKEYVDIIWNALHGTFGEDGTLSAFLNELGIPYTGPDEYQGKITVDKSLFKNELSKLGIMTPASFTVRDFRSIYPESFKDSYAEKVAGEIEGGLKVGEVDSCRLSVVRGVKVL